MSPFSNSNNIIINNTSLVGPPGGGGATMASTKTPNGIAAPLETCQNVMMSQLKRQVFWSHGFCKMIFLHFQDSKQDMLLYHHRQANRETQVHVWWQTANMQNGQLPLFPPLLFLHQNGQSQQLQPSTTTTSRESNQKDHFVTIFFAFMRLYRELICLTQLLSRQLVLFLFFFIHSQPFIFRPWSVFPQICLFVNSRLMTLTCLKGLDESIILLFIPWWFYSWLFVPLCRIYYVYWKLIRDERIG